MCSGSDPGPAPCTADTQYVGAAVRTVLIPQMWDPCSPPHKAFSAPQKLPSQKTPEERAPGVCGGVCIHGPSSLRPKGPKDRASLILGERRAQASGKSTYWSKTATSQCPVYWRASLRARSLASDLQQKREAPLRRLSKGFSSWRPALYREIQGKAEPCEQP